MEHLPYRIIYAFVFNVKQLKMPLIWSDMYGNHPASMLPFLVGDGRHLYDAVLCYNLGAAVTNNSLTYAVSYPFYYVEAWLAACTALYNHCMSPTQAYLARTEGLYTDATSVAAAYIDCAASHAIQSLHAGS